MDLLAFMLMVLALGLVLACPIILAGIVLSSGVGVFVVQLAGIRADGVGVFVVLVGIALAPVLAFSSLDLSLPASVLALAHLLWPTMVVACS